MLEFGSDIVLDLHQFYQFDFLGWVMGRFDARPEFVLCMVEGLPPESRFKVGSLPNPNEVSREMVEYEASTAHTNTLLSQALAAFAGDKVKSNDLMPSWAQQPQADKARSHGGDLKQLHAAWSGGAPVAG